MFAGKVIGLLFCVAFVAMGAFLFKTADKTHEYIREMYSKGALGRSIFGKLTIKLFGGRWYATSLKISGIVGMLVGVALFIVVLIWAEPIAD